MLFFLITDNCLAGNELGKELRSLPPGPPKKSQNSEKMEGGCRSVAIFM